MDFEESFQAPLLCIVVPLVQPATHDGVDFKVECRTFDVDRR
jgi:hypothetical protein